jgi:hypothetical protein
MRRRRREGPLSSRFTVMQSTLIYEHDAGASAPWNFSSEAIERHWRRGHEDTKRVLGEPGALAGDPGGITVTEIRRDRSETDTQP